MSHRPFWVPPCRRLPARELNLYRHDWTCAWVGTLTNWASRADKFCQHDGVSQRQLPEIICKRFSGDLLNLVCGLSQLLGCQKYVPRLMASCSLRLPQTLHIFSIPFYRLGVGLSESELMTSHCRSDYILYWQCFRFPNVVYYFIRCKLCCFSYQHCYCSCYSISNTLQILDTAVEILNYIELCLWKMYSKYSCPINITGWR